MRWDGVGTWLPPGVPRSLDSQGLGSAQSVSLSVQIGGASRFYSVTFLLENPRARPSGWIGKSAAFNAGGSKFKSRE
ncbi:hypothetical protein TNCV_3178831, partial [Trichonephila clavipes]